MNIRILTLASGSEGNALLAEFGDVRLLVDAGISGKALHEALWEQSVDPESLSALLLTHEHIDHCRGIPWLMRQNNLPVYASRGTFEGLSRHRFFDTLPKEGFHLFKAGDSFEIRGVEVSSIPVSHDCLEPVAFRLQAEGYSFAAVTDLGSYDDTLIRALKGTKALLLEANHNIKMLETGPYPYFLKQRIIGDRGHLSNEAAAELLKELLHPGLKQVLLGHLSQTNNYPPLALKTVEQTVNGLPQAENLRLEIAPYRGPSRPITWQT